MATHVDIPVANLPNPPKAQPKGKVKSAPEPQDAPLRGTAAGPGVSPADPGFTPPTITKEEHDEEMEFFIPDSHDAEGEAQELAESAITSQETAEPPAPEATPEAPSKFDPNLLAVAEQFGLSKAEAESYGDPAHLLRTLNIMARTYDAQVDNRQEPPPVAPPAEPTFETIDVAKMEEDGFDPVIINLAKTTNALKATNEKLVAKLGEYEKIVPNLVQNEKQRQAAQREQGIAMSFRDAGYDAASFDAVTRQKIVARVSALYQTYQREGISPPVKEIIQAVIPMVVPGSRPKTNGSQLSPADERRLAASALAQRMDRRRNGQFKGIPSHARGGERVQGGKLRQVMIDKGYDPGQSIQADNDVEGMLPG